MSWLAGAAAALAGWLVVRGRGRFEVTDELVAAEDGGVAAVEDDGDLAAVFGF